MSKYKSLRDKIINLGPNEFNELALEVFRFQYDHNTVYRDYVNHLGRNVSAVEKVSDIPFLPISFFKSHRIRTGDWKEEIAFKSSGTTGERTSTHLLDDPLFYKAHSKRLFEQAYGPLTDYHILALLPAYLEREGSSLVYMADYFIKATKSVHSGFYLDNYGQLIQKIDLLKEKGDRKILLLGVSFALWDLAEQYPVSLKGHIVMETGGMKGRRPEIVRPRLHGILGEAFEVETVHSEYGMTELMSQAYSKGMGLFDLPLQMQVSIRDINDPFCFYESCNKTGGINIIDLGNLHSCAFIETQDLGILSDNGMLEILGRFDNSDIRGCNLLI